MHQVILRIPLRFANWLPEWMPDSIPVYGFGLMLFFAFIICMWLAGWRSEMEGIPRIHVQDLTIWVFIAGILGARIVYMIQYRQPLSQFLEIWNGGLVFYGSFVGGLIGYLLAYHFVLRKNNISFLKMADIITPSIALGLCIGRIGCLLNGCCYGNVACPECPSLHFPVCSPPRYSLVERGVQTAAGFTLSDDHSARVTAVEPGSAAAQKGLQAGDVIIEADGKRIHSAFDLSSYLVVGWPRGKTDLSLTVTRAGVAEPITLPSFAPKTLGLHPTQIYESISTFLLVLLLSAYFPFRKHDGEVLVLFMLGYSVHRFLNEMLRNDTSSVAFNMTLSQNGSLVMFAAGILLLLWIKRSPARIPSAVVASR